MDTAWIFNVLVLGVSVVAIILLGAVVLVRNPKHRLHQSFFLLTVASALWILTNLVFATFNDTSVQYAAALLSYGAAGLLVLFFLEYCLGIAGVRLNKRLASLIYIVGLSVSVASVLPGNLANDVTSDDKIMTNFVPLAFFGLYILIFVSAGLIALLRKRAKSTGVERSKISIILIGLALAMLVGMVFNLVLPILDNYTLVKVGPVATLLFVATSTYAIVRHRLFDIKLAAVRAITYGCALLTLSGVYYLFAYVLSVLAFSGQMTDNISISPVNILLALVLAFIFQPIKRFFDRTTNSIFYREEYKSDVFFAEFSTLLASTIDLRGLLERASKQLADTFKAEQAMFFLYYTNTKEHHMSAGTRGHSRIPIYDTRQLDEYVAASGTDIFLTDLIEDNSGIRRMLRSHKIALVMPLRHGEKITGYVLLGEHRSGSYTKRDLKVLSTVSGELVIAIQNALSLHELKELNATLQQRINVATKELRSSNAQLKHLDEVKDEFMSMASHQLRTPLTSMKGYLSMVLEGDTGPISPQQHKLLLEAFNSSERMVRLISDFLNVSRLQTGKFNIEKSHFDLRDVVKQEVTDLEIIANSHAIKLRLNMVKQPMPVHADEQKIRQVVMNFIDNAIYYSHPKSTIVINLEKIKEEVALTVVDTGIGVPDNLQTKLFTKFFRAPNARKQRPDGTGVGLYLARRVINAHRGAIIFSSKEGKGSTFGFRLPIDKNPLPEGKPEPNPVLVEATREVVKNK